VILVLRTSTVVRVRTALEKELGERCVAAFDRAPERGLVACSLLVRVRTAVKQDPGEVDVVKTMPVAGQKERSCWLALPALRVCAALEEDLDDLCFCLETTTETVAIKKAACHVERRVKWVATVGICAVIEEKGYEVELVGFARVLEQEALLSRLRGTGARSRREGWRAER